jgi:hypothetical protein
MAGSNVVGAVVVAVVGAVVGVKDSDTILK